MLGVWVLAAVGVEKQGAAVLRKLAQKLFLAAVWFGDDRLGDAMHTAVEMPNLAPTPHNSEEDDRVVKRQPSHLPRSQPSMTYSARVWATAYK